MHTIAEESSPPLRHVPTEHVGARVQPHRILKARRELLCGVGRSTSSSAREGHDHILAHRTVDGESSGMSALWAAGTWKIPRKNDSSAASALPSSKKVRTASSFGCGSKLPGGEQSLDLRGEVEGPSPNRILEWLDPEAVPREEDRITLEVE